MNCRSSAANSRLAELRRRVWTKEHRRGVSFFSGNQKRRGFLFFLPIQYLKDLFFCLDFLSVPFGVEIARCVCVARRSWRIVQSSTVLSPLSHLSISSTSTFTFRWRRILYRSISDAYIPGLNTSTPSTFPRCGASNRQFDISCLDLPRHRVLCKCVRACLLFPVTSALNFIISVHLAKGDKNEGCFLNALLLPS